MDASKARQDSPRRFGLSDAMILVGSIALGLAAIRWLEPDGLSWGNLIFDWTADDFSTVIWKVILLAVPLAMPMTLGLLASRLCKPRSRWRRLVRQPGFVASLALILGWIVTGATTAVSVFWYWGIQGRTPTTEQLWSHWKSLFCFPCSELAGFGVAVAWSTLLLVGRWRAEPSWLDRLGRVIGVAWIAMALLATIIRNMF